MYFTSFEQFINMDGHGFYVWLSYACFAFLVVTNIWIAQQRQRRLRKQIKSRLGRSAKA